MKRTCSFAALLLSLVLVGSTGAEDAQAKSMAEQVRTLDRISLWGKTICFAHAPSDATCDIRIERGMLEAKKKVSTAPPGSFRIFGWTFCTGAAAPSAEKPDACDLRVGVPRAVEQGKEETHGIAKS